MTTTFKNISAGFAVSFLGSVPLGVLNIIGQNIFSGAGILPLMAYMSGVVLIEMIVVLLTLKSAERLVRNIQMTYYLKIFSSLFLIAMACGFYFSPAASSVDFNWSLKNISPFFLGLFLSMLNFVQLPFWAGWNLVLLQSNKIESRGYVKYFYIIATVIGTITGMVVFILLFDLVIEQSGQPVTIINKAIALILFVVALWQILNVAGKRSTQRIKS